MADERWSVRTRSSGARRITVIFARKAREGELETVL
jgi:hypothetical protein